MKTSGNYPGHSQSRPGFAATRNPERQNLVRRNDPARHYVLLHLGKLAGDMNQETVADPLSTMFIVYVHNG